MAEQVDKLRELLKMPMIRRADSGDNGRDGRRSHIAGQGNNSCAADGSQAPTMWCRDRLAGRLVELSGNGAVASLTAAMGLVLDAQRQSEPAAWIHGLNSDEDRPSRRFRPKGGPKRGHGSTQARRHRPSGTDDMATFYPPDAAACGIDLEALVIVDAGTSANAARAAERLLRSGAFGLVVLDLGKHPNISPALSGRLAALAKRHDAAVLCLTRKSRESTSIGPLVSLRAEAVRVENERGTFLCKIDVIKDKESGPGWSVSEVVHGPHGLR